MTRNVEFYVSRATEKFEAGFTSKASKKAATDDLNSAAELLRREYRDVCLNMRDGDLKMPKRADEAYWMNTDLHLWNAKRRAELLGYLPEVETVADRFDDLAALRAQIKDAEIVKTERKADEREVKVMKSIRDMMELRKSQYERGLRLHDLFNGLPVTGNVHYVTNQHGTTFLRTFYYLLGQLTPLNVILGVMDAKAREAEAK